MFYLLPGLQETFHSPFVKTKITTLQKQSFNVKIYKKAGNFSVIIKGFYYLVILPRISVISHEVGISGRKVCFVGEYLLAALEKIPCVY